MRTHSPGLVLLACFVVACDLGGLTEPRDEGDGTGQAAVMTTQDAGDDGNRIVNLVDRDGGDRDGESAECTPGEARECYDGDPEHAGVGACALGTQSCKGDGVGSWSECSHAVLPEPELCINAIDDDCDGQTDEGCECGPGDTRDCYTGPAGTEDVGECHAGSQTCARDADGDGSSWGPCVGQVVPGETMCDGLDRACTGDPDAGCDCTVGQTRTCYTGPADTRNVGACHDGVRSCESNDGVAAWGAVCAGESRPRSEICGNAVDEDCDGSLVNGCAALECPDYLLTPTSQALELEVRASGVGDLAWTLLDAPLGGDTTASLVVDGDDRTLSTITPIIVGEYSVQVSGTDDEGASHECSFVVAALPHGLRVQLYWDGAGDLDLHLHDESRDPWFSDADCYYGTDATTWGAVLDLDRVDDGPESIHMDAPAIGMPYTIGVHHYGDAEGRVAGVQIFCDTSSGFDPAELIVSRPLAGTESGQCTGNDFWTVARVTFTAEDACTIEPIDSYRPSSEVCSGP